MANDPNKQLDERLLYLITQALDGDEGAFGQIYDLYFEKIYRFVFYRVNHKETCEDLVAEIFIRVWDNRREIAEPAAFNGWVFRTARNLVIDYYRSRKTVGDLAELENILEYEDNFLDRANLKFDQKNFMAALKTLSADQQLVIKLKFLDELDNDEIAVILDKPEGTVRVIQHRAINELKNLLDHGHPEV